MLNSIRMQPLIIKMLEALHVQQAELQSRYNQQAHLIEEATEVIKTAEAKASRRHQDLMFNIAVMPILRLQLVKRLNNINPSSVLLKAACR